MVPASSPTDSAELERGRRPAEIMTGLWSLDWAQGDWIIGEFGDAALLTETKAEAARLTRRDPGDITRLVTVCRAFPPDRRRDDLSFEHHVAAMKLEEEQRADLLAQAAAEGWSARQTRKAVLARRVEEGSFFPVEDDDPEDALYRSAAQACNRANPAVRRMIAEALEDAKFGLIEL